MGEDYSLAVDLTEKWVFHPADYSTPAAYSWGASQSAYDPLAEEVYDWKPGTTHLMPRAATRINQHAREAIQERKETGAAIELLRRSLEIDDRSATTWMLLGATHELAGQPGRAIEAYRRALALFPGYAVAATRLAQLERSAP